MDGNQVFILGIGLQSPWMLVGQNLDTSTKPSVLTLNVAADRGSLYPCSCAVRPALLRLQSIDLAGISTSSSTFQHHCFINAQVPRTKCEDTVRILVSLNTYSGSFEHPELLTHCPVWFLDQVFNCVQFSELFAHGFAFEFNPVGIVHEPVKNGLGQSFITNAGVPLPGGQLTGHQRGLESRINAFGGLYSTMSAGPYWRWICQN